MNGITNVIPELAQTGLKVLASGLASHPSGSSSWAELVLGRPVIGVMSCSGIPGGPYGSGATMLDADGRCLGTFVPLISVSHQIEGHLVLNIGYNSSNSTGSISISNLPTSKGFQINYCVLGTD